jgi:hypothetical protein
MRRSRFLFLLGVSPMALKPAALAQSNTLKDGNNASLLHELDGAAVRAIAYLKSSQPTPGLPFSDQGSPAVNLESLIPFGKLSLPYGTVDTSGVVDQAEKLPPLSTLASINQAEVAREFLRGYFAAEFGFEKMTICYAADSKEMPRDASMDPIWNWQVLRRDSTLFGGLQVGAKTLDLQHLRWAMALVLRSATIREPSGVWPARSYVLRCQISEGPLAGSFAPFSLQLYPAPREAASVFVSTAAALHLLNSLGGSRANDGAAERALDWLQTQEAELIKQPFSTLVEYIGTIDSLAKYSVKQPDSRFQRWPRLWAERLINEQEGDGSWKPRPGWEVQAPVKVTLQALRLLADLREVL